jgi:hypothetical protein
MNPATATLFIISGITLAISIQPKRSPFPCNLAKVLATIVVLAAFSELLELAAIWHSRVDDFLFASKLSDAKGGLPNRMAPNTTLNFLFVGFSLLTLNLPVKRLSHSQPLAILIGFGALLPIT